MIDENEVMSYDDIVAMMRKLNTINLVTVETDGGLIRRVIPKNTYGKAQDYLDTRIKEIPAGIDNLKELHRLWDMQDANRISGTYDMWLFNEEITPTTFKGVKKKEIFDVRDANRNCKNITLEEYKEIIRVELQMDARNLVADSNESQYDKERLDFFYAWKRNLKSVGGVGNGENK